MEVQMKYKWATLGTGVIANELVQAWAMGGNLYSVANRTYDKGVEFAQNMASRKFIEKSMKCLRILKWTLSIFLRLTIPISII